MSKNAKTDATIAELEAHADAIRAELKVPKQAELDFVAALPLEQVAQSLLTASQYPAS